MSVVSRGTFQGGSHPSQSCHPKYLMEEQKKKEKKKTCIICKVYNLKHYDKGFHPQWEITLPCLKLNPVQNPPIEKLHIPNIHI